MAQYQRAHTRLDGGRIAKSLGTRDADLAAGYVGTLNTLLDRGDFHVLEAWRAGDLHIGDLHRAVREGDYRRLSRVGASTTRLDVAVEEYMERTEATGRDNTVMSYRVVTGALLRHFPDATMEEVGVREAEAFLHAPREETGGAPWAPATQQQARWILSGLWRMVMERQADTAEREGVAPSVTRNPWRKVRTAKRSLRRHSFLQPEEWRDLIHHPAVEGTPAAAFLGVLCLAGLRIAEARYLRTDIDVAELAGERPALHVQGRTGEWEWEPKHEHSVRTLPLWTVPELVDLLREHQRRGYAGARYFFRAAGRDRPIGYTTAKGWVRSAMEAAGVDYGRAGDGLTPHSLRHTFGSWLAIRGVPFHLIAKLMGNSAAVVISTYAHLAPRDEEAALAKIHEAVK